MVDLGDFDQSDVVYWRFNSHTATGAPSALSGGAVAAYKDDSAAQSTDGLTLTADFDGVTGLNYVAVNTAANTAFYANTSQFDVVLTAGTVDGTSVAGTVLGHFSVGLIDAQLASLEADVDAILDDTGTSGVKVAAGQSASLVSADTSTYLSTLRTIRAQVVAQLSDMTSSPKPDYGGSGLSVSWGAHFNNLLKCLADMEERIARATQPHTKYSKFKA